MTQPLTHSLSLLQNESYGSIDELLGRYIAPMNDYVEELMNHRKFMEKAEDEVDDELKRMKKNNPKAIPYAICWMEMHPGYASLRFVASVTPRSHPVGIAPGGFSWGAKTYASLDELINAFKKNPRGTAVKPKASPKRTASPTPPPAPAPPASKPASRWGPATSQPTAQSWSVAPSQPRPAVPTQAPPVNAWGSQPAAPLTGGWNQAPPPPRPPPPSAPPPRPPPPNIPRPPAYSNPPPPRPPPPPSRPPPRLPPPPQAIPPPQRNPPGPPAYGQPPVPAFNNFQNPNAGGPSQGAGRGRGKTLPAWMTKSQS